jgi:hypothetical protein
MPLTCFYKILLVQLFLIAHAFYLILSEHFLKF